MLHLVHALAVAEAYAVAVHFEIATLQRTRSSGTPPRDGVYAACSDALGRIRLFEPAPRPALELVRPVLASTAEGIKSKRDDVHRRDQRHAAVVSRRLVLGAFPALGWLERSIGFGSMPRSSQTGPCGAPGVKGCATTTS